MPDHILFPDVRIENWQMMQWERIALTGILSRLRPKGAIEVGVYHGGSLSLAQQYCEHIIGINIDPAVRGRVAPAANVELLIAPSATAIPDAFARHAATGRPVNYVLVDADHSAEGVRRDLELVLQYTPTEPMIIVMHDTGNPDTRRGLMSVEWDSNPYLKMFDFDFVPGQIIEHSVSNGRGEIWGGLGLAYLDPTPRQGPPLIIQSAATSIRCLHHCAPDLGVLRKSSV